ncbi:MAG: SDR family oxidoreductase [Propionicimonas sp.]|uniref:SDR family oxidoreductase n=1 Tax=Propionicimonas sp. TaxID=1955623 RepID=UPI003D0E4185
MSQPLIAVTGATGHVGGLVADQLAAKGTRLRLVVRDPGRLPAGRTGGTEVVRATYADSAETRAALADVDVLFMVSASESEDRLAQHFGLIDAAAAAGVRQVVYTSFLGAGPDATFTLARDHWATEEHLRGSGMAPTLLRDSFYLDFLPTMAGDDGVIRGPAGTGRVGAVARADVARVAATVLGDPARHAGATYDLTGPEALSLADVAAVVTRVTGRPTSYAEETVEEAYASRAHYGAPAWQVDAWVSTYTAIANGELSAVTDAVRNLTGAAPLSLSDLLLAARP